MTDLLRISVVTLGAVSVAILIEEVEVVVDVCGETSYTGGLVGRGTSLAWVVTL